MGVVPIPAPPPPSLAEFQEFITNVMGIQPKYLPSTAPVISFSLNFALAEVNLDWQCINPFAYNIMVYNLAANFLVNFAPDVPDVFVTNPDGSQRLDVDNQPIGYFAFLRKDMDLTGFASGFLQSTADEGTSASFVVPDAMKNLSFQDLQVAKTPWGRQYLGMAQKYGRVGGIS